MGRFGLDKSASGKVLVGFCDHCSEPLGSTEDLRSSGKEHSVTLSFYSLLVA